MAKAKVKTKKTTQGLGKFELAVAARIKELRLKTELTAEVFAYENDFNRAQYYDYERGKDIRLSSLNRLCKAFKVTIQEFFAEGF